MTKPAPQLQAALHRIDDRWDEARTERTLAALHGRRALRRRQRLLLSAAAGLCALALCSWQLRNAVLPGAPSVLSTAAPSGVSTAAEPNPLQLRLSDGSEVTLRDARSRVVAHKSTDSLIELELEAGQARFEVTPNKQRVFRVHSGDVSVEVLGTAFEVERQAERSHVVVLRGRVAVRWQTGRSGQNSGQTVLSAREAGWFPRLPGSGVLPEPAGVALKELVETETQRAPSALPARHSKRASGPAHKRVQPAASGGWRETAEAGDFAHAYELMQRTAAAPPDSVEELLLAADTARLSGHPRAALPFLTRVVSDHASDSRAPLAAFTLGGILMQQLGQPREAQAAYARARELSPSSALAEDAMARQVEAASRAGDSAHAAALAKEYLEHYPTGRRVHAVRRFGSLSAD